MICDGKSVRTIKAAKYDNNVLAVGFPPVTCKNLELKITGSYGASPAIRELQVYNPESDKRQSSENNGPNYQWRQTEDSLALLNGEKIIWRSNHKVGQGKPSIYPLGLADGTELTWFRPPDHIWHRSLWFTWKFINGVNYWEEDKDGQSPGRTEVADVKVERADEHVQIEMDLRFFPVGKKPVLTEKRIIKISIPDEKGGYTIDWKGVFTAVDKDLEFNRTPLPGQPGGVDYGGYAGLSLRMAKNTRDWKFLDSEGRRDGKAIHGQPARWICNYGSAGNGKEAAAAMFDHPDNLRHPVSWYVAAGMPYFSPAVIFNEPYRLPAGKSFALKYRVIVFSDALDSGQLDSMWKEFTGIDI